MDLQTIFYVLAITIMSLMLLTLIAAVAVIFVIKQKVDAFKKHPLRKTISFATNNSQIASIVGMMVWSFIQSKFMKKRQEES